MLNINSYFKEGLAKVEQRSINWLLSAEASTARCNRLTESGATHIVHVEVHGGSLSSPLIYDLSDFEEDDQ